MRTLLAQHFTLRHFLHKVYLLLLYVDRESLELRLPDNLCDDLSLLGAGGGLLCPLGTGMSLAVAFEGFAEFGVMAAFVVKVYRVCRGRVSVTTPPDQLVSQWFQLPSGTLGGTGGGINGYVQAAGDASYVSNVPHAVEQPGVRMTHQLLM